MQDWTEKYRPQSLKQVIGNQQAKKQLLTWATQWKNATPTKKAVIISGKPGIGKTSAAYAIAHDFHWTPIELNTSDARNEQQIKAIATAGATHQTFDDQGTFITTHSGGRKLIILDEADNLYERITGNKNSNSNLSDRGGKKAIIHTIKITQQPMILIVNDYYQLIKGSGSILKRIALHLKWYPPFSSEIQRMLHQICEQEHITADATVLQQISKTCKGDLRSAVRDLQSLCVNKTMLSKDDASVLGKRDRESLIFDVLKHIFNEKENTQIRQEIRNLDEDPRSLLFWVAENIPASYRDPQDRALAFDMTSKGDVYLGRTFRRQYYGFWSYASDLVSLGVAAAKTQKTYSTKFLFPTWLRSVKKKRKQSLSDQLLLQQISRYHHCSLVKAKNDVLPYYSLMIQNDNDLSTRLISKLNDTNDSTNTFFEKHKSKPENKESKPISQKDSYSTSSENDKEEKKEKEKTDDEKKQRLLFDF